jgi:hypothetical protein
MRLIKLTTAALLLSLVACSDSTGPGNNFESIAGSYDGVLAGLSQGIALDATFSLTINQTGGTATGSWALQGTLDDGFDLVTVQGTGNLSGTVASGTNPSVNLTVRTGSCPNYQAQFSGSYDSTNRVLTISGPVDFFAAGTCTVLLTFPSTILLYR